ncbi:MAG: hypothetical protein AAB305_00020 [Candidatus Zixiibacteriota bacterium]
MKKLLILTTLMVLAFAMIANANLTRVQTMGSNSDVLLDPSNIFDYYSRINDYPKWAIGEFGNSYDGNSFGTFGVNWQFGAAENPWVLGTYFHNSDSYQPWNDETSVYYPFYLENYPFEWVEEFSNLPNQRIDLFYGRNLGGNPFGFHLGYVNSSQSEELAGTDQWKGGLSKISIGGGLTLNEGKFDISAGLDYVSWTDQYNNGTATVDVTKPSGNMSFWLMGRMFRQVNEQLTWTPHGKISLGSGGVEFYGSDAVLDETDDLSLFELNLGSGLQWNPNQDATCVLDFGVDYGKITHEYTYAPDATYNYKENQSAFTLPYFKMGAEGKVFDWLWARFGSTSYWTSAAYEDETAQYKYKRNYPMNETIVGLGFVFNRLHVDANVNPELFLDGFNFISGQSNPMNFNFTVLYDLH